MTPYSDERLSGIDTMVGMNLKKARAAAGVSLRDLGRQVNLSPQQLIKYERAVNRLSASRMYQIGRALGVTPDHFFRNVI